MDDLLFRSTEYPAGWDNGQDPDDYKPLSAPLNPQFVFNNSMLWYRASFKIEYKYLPMSFCQFRCHEMRRNGCTSRILMTLPFSARKLLQAKTSRMGLDHRAKIVTSSFDVVDNDEFIGGANLVKEFGGIIYTGTS
jgi:hypothetical protein